MQTIIIGPPGTGKTILARAVAHETNSYFINISGPEIMSKYFGEAESKLREILIPAEIIYPASRMKMINMNNISFFKSFRS